MPISDYNLYIAFVLEDPITYDPFLDEGVYIPKAYFKRAEIKVDAFDWKEIQLKREGCQREKFGNSYQEIFAQVDLTNRYCLKDINNFILEGHFSYLLYSFFILNFILMLITQKSKIVSC